MFAVIDNALSLMHGSFIAPLRINLIETYRNGTDDELTGAMSFSTACQVMIYVVLFYVSSRVFELFRIDGFNNNKIAIQLHK